MDEKKKEENKSENSAILEIPKPEKICQSTCKICSSNNLSKIHQLRKDGKNYDHIVQLIETEDNEQISKSSLSRHFSNYNKQINLMSAEIINTDMVEQATLQSVHLIKVVSLIDIALLQIDKRVKENSYRVDIGDLEKLMNLRYKLLSGESNSNDLVALFQQASEKYGMQQGVLFN